MPRTDASRLDLAQPSLLIDLAVGLTIAAMFSGLNQHVGPIKVQLSDGLALLTVFLVGIRGFASPHASRAVLVALAAYLIFYCTSGLAVSATDGAKELFQTVLLFSFMFALFGHYRTRSTDRVFAVTAMLIVAVLCYNVGWHVSHGRYVGWKELNEPKTVFTLLPLLLILLADRFRVSGRRVALTTAVLLAAVVIFLSGERKAYIFAVVAACIWTAPLNWRHGVALLLLVPAFLIAVSADQTGYLSRQINSVVDVLPGSSSRGASITSLIDAHRPTTFSDAQREFSNRYAADLWSKRPVLGIGTGAFAEAMAQQTSVPEEFRMNIHGEFMRALYENGIVGLLLYLSIWVAALARIAGGWSYARAVGDANLNKIKLACFAMLLIYCSFEASKGLTLACICVLAFVVALPPRVRAVRARALRRVSAIERPLCAIQTP